MQRNVFRLSFKAVIKLLAQRPAYGLLSLGVAFAVWSLLLWLFNINFLFYLLGNSSIGWTDKLNTIGSVYSAALSFASGLSSTSLLVSILFGINVSALVYVIKRRGSRTINKSRSYGAFVAAAIGSGCAACGTSLVTPLLYALGVTSTVALSRSIGTSLNLISLLLLTFSIYSVGQQVAIEQAKPSK